MYFDNVAMSGNMPHGHYNVQHEYSCGAVERLNQWAHSPPMKNMKRIRIDRKLNQTQLADMVGTTQPTISKIEKGDMNVTLGLIEACAKALGVTPVELFGLSEAQQRVLDVMSALPEDRRAAAFVVLEAMSRAD